VKGKPIVKQMQNAVWINKPIQNATQSVANA